MRGTPVPIKDIYSDRTHSEARHNQQLPSTTPVASPSPAGISHAPPVEKKQVVPDIAPMRRGRPTAPVQASTSANTLSPAAKSLPSSAAKGDPFAALDSRDYEIRAGAVDELASRFPSIDDFSIAVDKGAAFQFPSSQPSQPSRNPGQRPNDTLTNALADEVFASTKSTKPAPPKPEQKSTLPSRSTSVRKADAPAPSRESVKRQSVIQQPIAVRPGYTSTGTMTSPPPPMTTTRPPPAEIKMPDISKRPIWRVPEVHRSSSQPRASPASQAAADALQPSAQHPSRPPLLDIHRSKSQTATTTLASPIGSRPSIEGHRRISQLFTGESITRTKSASSVRPRPVSAAFVESNLDYLRTQERESAERKRPSLDVRRPSRLHEGNEALAEETSIEDDRDFLRSLEREKPSRSRESSMGHKKRSSVPALMNKFGDAFKRFERTKGSDGKAVDESPVSQPPSRDSARTPSPRPREQGEPYNLSPISGSEATATPPRQHAEGSIIDHETEDLPPAMRRELERQRIAAEERRVAQAAEEYRNRKTTGAPPPPSKANAIQQRVQAFLDEGRQSPKPKRTAEGYGRYTEEEQAERQAERQQSPPPPQSRKGPPPAVARKPFAPQSVPAPQPNPPLSYNKTRQVQQPDSQPTTTTPAMTAQYTAKSTTSRPSAPPKPKTLTTGGSGYQARPSSSSSSQAQTQAQPQIYQGTGRGPSLAALLARDNEGVATMGSNAEERVSIPEERPAKEGYAMSADDWEADFSKRYPSLSGIEMVETEISSPSEGIPQKRGMRVKEV